VTLETETVSIELPTGISDTIEALLSGQAGSARSITYARPIKANASNKGDLIIEVQEVVARFLAHYGNHRDLATAIKEGEREAIGDLPNGGQWVEGYANLVITKVLISGERTFTARGFKQATPKGERKFLINGKPATLAEVEAVAVPSSLNPKPKATRANGSDKTPTEQAVREYRLDRILSVRPVGV